MDDSPLSQENVLARIAAAEEIHKRAHERDREHQRVLDALAGAELNLKAARIAEAQANTRATTAEAALARHAATAGIDPEELATLHKQIGESRRLESAATSEAAALRQQLDDARRQFTSVAGDDAQAAMREETAKARAEYAAATAKNSQLARELEQVKARNAQLESAALTIQARASAPVPELAEARTEAEKARQAARSAEGNVGKLRRDLTDAQTRIKALEITLAATRAAISSSTSISGDLAAARRDVADLRNQLNAARSEIGRLKQNHAPRPPREPRPDRREPRDPSQRSSTFQSRDQAAPEAPAPIESDAPAADSTLESTAPPLPEPPPDASAAT